MRSFYCLLVCLCITAAMYAQKPGELVTGTFYYACITYPDSMRSPACNVALKQLPERIGKSSLKDMLCGVYADGLFIDDPNFAQGFADVHKGHMADKAVIKKYNDYQTQLTNTNRYGFKTRAIFNRGLAYIDFVKVTATFEVRKYVAAKDNPSYIIIPAACYPRKIAYSFVEIKKVEQLGPAEKQTIVNRYGLTPVGFDGEPLQKM